jgi:hypothetical protein
MTLAPNSPKDAGLWTLAVTYIDDFPGFICCEFHDMHGSLHQILDKVPVITLDDIDEKTQLPMPVKIPGTILEHFCVDGRTCIRFKTAYSIQSTAGLEEFCVWPSQVD